MRRDWIAIHETLFLLSVPGMRESIREGMDTPVEECDEELDWLVGGSCIPNERELEIPPNSGPSVAPKPSVWLLCMDVKPYQAV